MKCPWCYHIGNFLPLSGEVGKIYSRCSNCNNFVPIESTENTKNIERYVAEHGEEYRRLIIDALHFLDHHEESWVLDEPINRDEYIAGLVRSVV